MPAWLIPALVVAGVLFFIAVLTCLPDHAYGEDDIRVFSEETVLNRKRTHIVVLGDIGRSPRMQYHAISLGRLGVAVDLVGYVETELHPEIVANRLIKVHPIDKTPEWIQNTSLKLFPVYGILKALWQFTCLYIIIAQRIKPAKFIIVQNPPSIPALFTVWLVAFFRKSQVVVDWHNFGYSMLGLKLGDRHKMVAYAKMYEKWFGRRSTVNLTVTDAMAKKLKRDFKITAPVITVHDRPGPDFEPLDNDERLQFLNLLPETASHIEAIKKGRLKVLVSSTSWTPDEDFSLLLDALVGYSQLATSSHPHIPELLVIITGKGPLKEKYVAQIAELKAKGQLEMVEVKTAWFSISYYAALLGAADIGISLHTSSSGVDLPMKVLDMFGAGLPVLGWSDFEAWPELGKEGVNSRGFKNAKELETALVELLGPDGTELKTLKAGAIEESKRGWEDEWKSTVGKLLDAC